MPLHNFQCSDPDCGHIVHDQLYLAKDVPRWRKCPECGKRAYQSWEKGFNKKRSLSDILGAGMDHHPQMGTDIKIESPDHYKQLLKEFEMEEAGDPQRGSKDWMKDKLHKERTRPERETAEYATEQQIAQAKL